MFKRADLLESKEKINAEEFGLSDEELTEEELELISSLYIKYKREEMDFSKFIHNVFRPLSR